MIKGKQGDRKKKKNSSTFKIQKMTQDHNIFATTKQHNMTLGIFQKIKQLPTITWIIYVGIIF